MGNPDGSKPTTMGLFRDEMQTGDIRVPAEIYLSLCRLCGPLGVAHTQRHGRDLGLLHQQGMHERREIGTHATTAVRYVPRLPDTAPPAPET